MARYGRDYGDDYGRWQQQPPQYGGMRSDGGPGGRWRDFPGEEGWYGEGYEGMPGGGFDRVGREQWGGGQGGGYGADFRGGNAFGQRSGGRFGGPGGYSGRDAGYGGGWGGGRGGQQGGQWQRTRAAEIMTQNPEAVTPDATISTVARKMKDLDVGIIPVVESEDNRRLQGVITDRDIAIRAVAEGKDGNVTVSDCMTRDVETVNKNDSVRDVMRLMRQEQVRRVPVVDREGRLVGIIAQADLAVDYAGDREDRELRVGSTIERISEPARPERSGRMAAGERERGGQDSRY